MFPPDSDSSDSSSKGGGSNRNRRPPSSKRVTFALGQAGQDQADRLARVLSSYRKGGVSQSALIRVLLRIAESAALRSGDPAVAPVYGPEHPASQVAESSGTQDAVSAALWERIRNELAHDEKAG